MTALRNLEIATRLVQRLRGRDPEAAAMASALRMAALADCRRMGVAEPEIEAADQRGRKS